MLCSCDQGCLLIQKLRVFFFRKVTTNKITYSQDLWKSIFSKCVAELDLQKRWSFTWLDRLNHLRLKMVDDGVVIFPSTASIPPNNTTNSSQHNATQHNNIYTTNNTTISTQQDATQQYLHNQQFNNMYATQHNKLYATRRK